MYKRRMGFLLLCGIFATLLFGCGKTQQENKTTEKETNRTLIVTTKEETTQQETLRYSVTYTAVIDTSGLTDKETSDAIRDLRERAVENHMQIELGQASYKELVLNITCYYNKEEVKVNDVREKLLSGFTVKSIQ